MMMIEAMPLPFITAIAGIFGACVGSFLTLITHRLPHSLPVVNTRSVCANCSKQLKIRDLIPLFSWILARGKARCCGARISVRYPLTELACVMVAVVMTLWMGVNAQSLLLMGLLWGVVAIVVTDMEYQIILDEVQIALLLMGVTYALIMGRAPEDIFAGAAVGVGFGVALKYGFMYFAGKDGLGLGDVKFLGVAGVWLPAWQAFVPFMFYAGVLGIISAIAWQQFSKEAQFPFGPSLAFSLVLCVLYPDAARGFFTLYGALSIAPVF